MLFRDQISSDQSRVWCWHVASDVTASAARCETDATVMGRGTEDVASDESGDDKPGVMRDESITNAATKIQAGFRGYKVRKQLKQTGGSVKKGARRRSSAHGEVAAVTAGKQRSASLEERSATTIQAGIRGFLVRKKRQEETQAATKIQAGFRGFKARRAAKSRVQVQK